MSPFTQSRYLRRTGRRRRRSARSLFLILMVILIAVAAMLTYIWVRVYVLRQQMIITGLEAEIQRLESDNEYLKMELQHLSGASQLEMVARRCGFIYPVPEQIIRIAK